MKKGFKEIFLFVTGVTPQIVTETLYALHHRTPPVNPDEIVVVTTTTGRERLEKLLLSDGRLAAFFKEFGIAPIRPVILAVPDAAGAPLTDIRTAEENRAAGDFIADIVRQKTADEKSRLHASIAGGRKTMSYYLGAAMNLFARPQDRLYHVLVTPEFESQQDFYWKPKKTRNLTPPNPLFKKEGELIDRGVLNTEDAEITLAELPFVRLREKFPVTGKGFVQLVEEGQKEIDSATAQLPLKVNFPESSLEIGGTKIKLEPMKLVVYNAFIRRKKDGCMYKDRISCLDCTACFPYLTDLNLDWIVDDYRLIYPNKHSRVEDFKERKKKEPMTVGDFLQCISKINRAIKEALKDDILASLYTVISVGRHGDKRHGVRVDRERVRL